VKKVGAAAGSAPAPLKAALSTMLMCRAFGFAPATAALMGLLGLASGASEQASASRMLRGRVAAKATAALRCSSCIDAYDKAGGCKAMREVLRLIPAGCSSCGDQAQLRCSARNGFLAANESLAAAEVACGSCASAFAAAGGCRALQEMERLIPAGCLPCGEQAAEHCLPQNSLAAMSATILVAATAPSCDACVDAFEKASGCEAVRSGNYVEALRLIPAGCASCGKEAAEHCELPMADLPTCSSCLDAFEKAGGCEAMWSGNSTEVLRLVPLGCLRCGEQAAERCLPHSGSR